MLLHQDTTEAEPRRNRGNLPRVIRLDAADRHERVAALGQRLSGEELQLPHLVAAVGEAGVAVLALRPDLDLAAKMLAQSSEPMHRRRAEPQRHAGEAV